MAQTRYQNQTLHEKIYLIGLTSDQLDISRLPTNHEVLARFFHWLRAEKKSSKISSFNTANEVMLCWKNADIPTILEKSITRKVMKLYNKWMSIYKTKNQKSSFREDLHLLFDISKDSNMLDLNSYQK